MSESQQHVLSRVRPPRVQITYDVETLGSVQKKELPFIVGILADLSGKPEPNAAEKPPKLKDRKFVEIDRDNFDAVMEKIAPRLAFNVKDVLGSDPSATIGVTLNLTKMADFRPESVVTKVPGLKELYEARTRLNDLLAKLDGNDNLGQLLTQVLESADPKLEELRAELSQAKATGKLTEAGKTDSEKNA